MRMLFSSHSLTSPQQSLFPVLTTWFRHFANLLKHIHVDSIKSLNILMSHLAANVVKGSLLAKSVITEEDILQLIHHNHNHHLKDGLLPDQDNLLMNLCYSLGRLKDDILIEIADMFKMKTKLNRQNIMDMLSLVSETPVSDKEAFLNHVMLLSLQSCS